MGAGWKSTADGDEDMSEFDLEFTCEDKLAEYLLSGDILPCEQCGCLGNESCGHEPYDDKWNCSLKWDLRCACCHVRDN